MTSASAPLAAALTQTASGAPAAIATAFDAATRELTASGIAPGLEVGDEAPEFVLPDQLGHDVSLAEQLAQGPVVLVFYRGDWCPYCNLTLRALQRELGAIHRHGAKLVAVSPQAPDHSLTLAEKQGLEFPILSDGSQATIAAYGLRYLVPPALQDVYLTFGNDLREQNPDATWNLPVPATFVIDQRGMIRARFVDMDFTKRMEPADIVSVVAGLTGAGPPCTRDNNGRRRSL